MAMKLPGSLSRIWNALRLNPQNALQVNPADPTQRGHFRVILSNNANVKIDHDTAFAVSAVWACIDIIASALSSSEWNVYRGVRGADQTEAIPEDGLQYVLNTRFNSEMTAQAGKRAMMIAAVGYGNGYAEIETDLANRVVALWPIEPDRVEPRREIGTNRLIYRVTQDYAGGYVDMDPSQILHIRGPGILGNVGDDVLYRTVQTLAQAVALDQFASSYFGNNAQLGTVFMFKGGKVDDATYTRMKDQIEQRHRGSRRAFRSAILDGGEWDVKTIGNDANDAQLVNAKHLSIEDICRYFHVPPHKVQHLLRATNNNIEHQGLEFSRDTLRPWKKEIEQECDFKLMSPRARKFVEIDLDWAEQGDYKSRAEAFQILRGMGVFSANDVLRKLGENTIGPDGDIRIVQGANVRLEDVGAAYAKPAAAPAPAPSDSEDEDEDEDDAVEEVTAQWLTQVYSNCIHRYNVERQNRGDSSAKLRAAKYACGLLDDMKPVLGTRYSEAVLTVENLFTGIPPKDAARAVMEKKP